jgi:hypothetical protein
MTTYCNWKAVHRAMDASPSLPLPASTRSKQQVAADPDGLGYNRDRKPRAHNALMVLVAIARYFSLETGRTHRSTAQISEETHLSITAVKRAVADLVKSRHLIRKTGEDGASNEYAFGSAVPELEPIRKNKSGRKYTEATDAVVQNLLDVAFHKIWDEDGDLIVHDGGHKYTDLIWIDPHADIDPTDNVAMTKRLGRMLYILAGSERVETGEWERAIDILGGLVVGGAAPLVEHALIHALNNKPIGELIASQMVEWGPIAAFWTYLNGVQLMYEQGYGIGGGDDNEDDSPIVVSESMERLREAGLIAFEDGLLAELKALESEPEWMQRLRGLGLESFPVELLEELKAIGSMPDSPRVVSESMQRLRELGLVSFSDKVLAELKASESAPDPSGEQDHGSE